MAYSDNGMSLLAHGIRLDQSGPDRKVTELMASDVLVGSELSGTTFPIPTTNARP